MPDMLVKLYDLREEWDFLRPQREQGILLRKPIGPEKHWLQEWVRLRFGDAWSSEADMAMSNRPVSCFLATKDQALVGFACYDATALGFFGPIGVEESFRRRGTGRALLLACLLDMRLRGYGYAVIGSTNLFAFYEKCAGATVIPDSTPGIWKDWVRRPDAPPT